MLTMFGQRLHLYSELAWLAHLGALGCTTMGATKVEGFTKMTITSPSLLQIRIFLAEEKALIELYKVLGSGNQIGPAQAFCTSIQWRPVSGVWWPSLVANGQGMRKLWPVKVRGDSQVMLRHVLCATCPGLAAYVGMCTCVQAWQKGLCHLCHLCHHGLLVHTLGLGAREGPHSQTLTCNRQLSCLELRAEHTTRAK